MIDVLTDENPMVKHAAAEWLCSAKKVIPCLLDPILSFLLHKNTQRQDMVYVKEHDTRRTFEAIRKLKVVLEAGKGPKQWMDQALISSHVQTLLPAHNISMGTYLEIIVVTLLLFLNSVSQTQEQQNQVLRMSVCELLQDS